LTFIPHSGKVTVNVPAGTQPAVLFLKKADSRPRFTALPSLLVTGKVTVNVPAGTQPAVLFLEKADDASKAAQQGPKYKGQVDYIATVTVKGQG
jgi:hypothetical protein